MLTALDGEAESIDAIDECRLVKRLALDERFQRHASGIEPRRIEPRIWRDRASYEACHGRDQGAPARHDRRARVLAVKLPYLPLAAEQPQWIVCRGGVPGRHVLAYRLRLQA